MYNAARQADTPWPAEQQFAYSHHTATSGLRNHLDRFHRAQYTDFAIQYGWTNALPSFKKEQAAQEAARAQALNLVHHAPGPVPFTSDGLLARLVEFIVSNDQVGLNIFR